MAAYFHGSSEIQADGLQTLYLMNPNYVASYSDTQHQQPSNMLFLNSMAGNALNPASVPHAPPPQNQQFLGIPLPAVGSGSSSEDPNRPVVHEISALHGVVPRFHYNLWGTAAQQGLSLTLSSQQQGCPRSVSAQHEISGQGPATVISPTSGSGGSSSSVSNGMQSVILGSKYLKAAQQLLDEVVNVGNVIKKDGGEKNNREKVKADGDSVGTAGGGGEGCSGGENGPKRPAELTTAQRQDLQMKKAKLVSMLDEVEQRYRQYHQQMQIAKSSFEQAAGIGSAKSYTALALQTISKQFRCLKDAITAQIKSTSKSLGEDDSLGAKVEGSRLKFVDHQLRQQRALQQLGMIQHNAWRPQRGLPERAVSVLRAWLFEHFLHPYPKDSDKVMLAKQTGLTRSQVSNWFINARVRLWKPMVEEMYMEELKNQEPNASENGMTRTKTSKESGSKSTTAPQENTRFHVNQTNSSLQSSELETQLSPTTPPTAISNPKTSTSPFGGSLQPQSGFALIGSSDMERMAQSSPKKPRSSDMDNSPSSILSMDMDMKAGETTKGSNMEKLRQTRDSYSFNHGSGFGSYSIGDIGRFETEHLATPYHGNSVSLTLGLPHCENLSLSGPHQNYLSTQNIHLGSRLNLASVDTHYNGVNGPQPSHSNAGYENINIQGRERFVAQLLPDFVA
ncbi:hypothetical protein NMG60_11033452 [Bertholletia excelsa]